MVHQLTVTTYSLGSGSSGIAFREQFAGNPDSARETKTQKNGCCVDFRVDFPLNQSQFSRFSASKSQDIPSVAAQIIPTS